MEEELDQIVFKGPIQLFAAVKRTKGGGQVGDRKGSGHWAGVEQGEDQSSTSDSTSHLRV